MGPTLDSWVWVVFYGFLIINLSIAVFNLLIGRIERRFSALQIISIFMFFGIFFINSMGRVDVTELTHFLNELARGRVWTIICLAFLLYIIGYFIVAIKDLFVKPRT